MGETENKTIPTFLKVLCILTFIGSGLAILGSLLLIIGAGASDPVGIQPVMQPIDTAQVGVDQLVLGNHFSAQFLSGLGFKDRLELCLQLVHRGELT